MERQVYDGFWLPQRIRQAILTQGTKYEMLRFRQGQPVEQDEEGVIAARWPRLDRDQWQRLLSKLQAGRQRMDRAERLSRLQAALTAASNRFADPNDSLQVQTLAALSGYTGYAPPMIELALRQPEPVASALLTRVFTSRPTDAVRRFVPLDGLPGGIRFYVRSLWGRWLGRLGVTSRHLSRLRAVPPELILGYAAGNVPGTGLLIALLGQFAALLAAEADPPVTIIRNSRREPLLAPFFLAAIEKADPELVSSTAVLVWNYDDRPLQEYLIAQADLVIAAASDETIADIGRLVAQVGRQTRFHAHGHKLSFTTIGREYLAQEVHESESGAELIDVVAALAALDSIFWEQNGCLSARIHFVEKAKEGEYSPTEYGRRAVAQLRRIERVLPRAPFGLRRLHSLFDKYKLLETTGRVQVLSTYDDGFSVVVDERAHNRESFRETINDGRERTVIIRPVADIMKVPRLYLRYLEPRHLQSMSVAIGTQGINDRFLTFAEEVGMRGVTAIRTVGRASFPRLGYSWDGLIPLDLVTRRPAGHFTTYEFDDPYADIVESYRQLRRWRMIPQPDRDPSELRQETV